MRLSRLQLTAVAGPAVPMATLILPLVIFIPPYFADQVGLGMAVVGTIFTLARLFDVITDPVAGVLMDRMHKRITKFTWVVLGAFPLGLATWQIFFPTETLSSFTLMMWLLVLYLGWTAMTVGLFSWASELAGDYHERSRVMGTIQMAHVVGTLLALSIPAGIELMNFNGNVARIRIEAMGALIIVLLPIMLFFAWRFSPAVEHENKPSNESMKLVIKQAFSNSALRRLIVADLAMGLNIAVLSSLSVFYIEIVLGLEGRAGIVQLAMFASSLLGLPLFIWMSGRFEKHKTLILAISWAASGALIASTAPVGGFIFTLLSFVAFGFSFGALQMLPRAIMADVLEELQLKTGSANTSTYFAFLATTFKLGLGLGVGLTYAIASQAGFDPVTARETDSAHWVIRAMIGGIPLILATIVFVSMWRFPLNRKRYEELRSSLA
ncbi:MAG: MFS transporter [Parasphingorhabdus sp.]